MSDKEKKPSEATGEEKVEAGLNEEQEAALGALHPDFEPVNEKTEASKKAKEKGFVWLYVEIKD